MDNDEEIHVIDAPLHQFTIKRIWAAIIVNEEGEEGLAAFFEPRRNMWFPLIAADETRLEWIVTQAERIAKRTHKKIEICEFTERKCLRVIEG